MAQRYQGRIVDPAGRRLADAFPWVLDLEHCRRVLYVGANPRRFHLHGMLHAGGDRELWVLEVWEPYAEALRSDERHPTAGVICGDVRDLLDILDVRRRAPFDLAVWWHGPEHVPMHEAARLLRRGHFDAVCSGALVCATPWGRHEQEPVDGNPLQAHSSTWYARDFERLGFHTLTRGRCGEPPNDLVAWRACVPPPVPQTQDGGRAA